MVLALMGAVVLTGYALLAPEPQWKAAGAAYGASFLLGAAGAILLIWSRGAPADDTEPEEDSGAVEQHLSRVVTALQDLNTNSENIDVQEVGRMIDTQLAEDVTGFTRARDFLSRLLNPEAFTNLMVRFDAGYRSIRQARTASAEGNAEGVWDNLGVAEQRMAEAYSMLKTLNHGHEHPSRN